MTDPEDQILVQQALKVDPESFGELCRCYYNSLLAVANSILPDHHLAEDAAQEALVAACRQLPRLKKPERFGPWIVAICRNIARDMLRENWKQTKCWNENNTTIGLISGFQAHPRQSPETASISWLWLRILPDGRGDRSTEESTDLQEKPLPG